MARIINLTPHNVLVVTEDGRKIEFPPEGVVARAAQVTRPDGTLEGVPMARVSYGKPEGLPAPERDVYLIVSALTISAAREAGRSTSDLLTVADPVRDAEGRVIGCRYLAYN